MKAALCRSFDGVDAIEIAELPEPAAGPGEVVVAVKAAALNFFDTLIIRNRYQYKPDLPFSPSAEIAGVVESVGTGVSNVSPGDRVAAYICYGGAREKVVVPANLLSPIPDAVDDVVASGVSVTYGTGYYGLVNRAQLKPGETIAILGASGGVGLAAVELSKLLGARVVALASSEEKLAIAAKAGADVGINYARADIKDALKDVGGEKGIDVVYDIVGGDASEAALRALGWGGRFLVIGFAAGEIPRIPLNLVLLKSVSVIGVFWGRFTEREPEAHVANTNQLLEWCAQGRLVPRIHGTFPLDAIADALGVIERREAVGKVVLTV